MNCKKHDTKIIYVISNMEKSIIPTYDFIVTSIIQLNFLINNEKKLLVSMILKLK